MIERRRIAGTVALSVLVSLIGVVVAVIVVVLVAEANPAFALSDSFFWGSASALVVLHLVVGAVSGRLAAARLSEVGLQGFVRFGLAAVGPALVALVTNLDPVDGIPPFIGTLAPVAAALVGVLAGIRMHASPPPY